MQQRRAQRCIEPRRDIGKSEHEERGRQRESEECRECAEPAAANEAEREADLAARGPRQKLRHGDELRVVRIVDPAPTLDEVAMKVADVCDRPTERREPQLQERREDLACRYHRSAFVTGYRKLLRVLCALANFIFFSLPDA